MSSAAPSRPAFRQALAKPGAQGRPRHAQSLARQLVERLATQVRGGEFEAGAKLPTEAGIIASFGVSRTVVREAISRLSAMGLVETRHGIGTFVLDAGAGRNFRIDPAELETIVEVLALLELRISLEGESAGIAATRRTRVQLQAMRRTLKAFERAVDDADSAVESDFQFHLRVAEATGNRYFSELMGSLGTMIIPRTRLNTARLAQEDRSAYLKRVNREHHDILAAIERQDSEGARAAMRTHLTNSRERLRRAHEDALRARRG